MHIVPIRYGIKNFIVSDSPTEDNINNYLRVYSHYGASIIVRLSTPTYKVEAAAGTGIEIVDIHLKDGSVPDRKVIHAWKKLLQLNNTVAIHCLTGLGRSPTMVIIALIEEGMSPDDAINYVRSKIPHCLNTEQERFLTHYKPESVCTVL